MVLGGPLSLPASYPPFWLLSVFPLPLVLPFLYLDAPDVPNNPFFSLCNEAFPQVVFVPVVFSPFPLHTTLFLLVSLPAVDMVSAPAETLFFPPFPHCLCFFGFFFSD